MKLVNPLTVYELKMKSGGSVMRELNLVAQMHGGRGRCDHRGKVARADLNE